MNFYKYQAIDGVVIRRGYLYANTTMQCYTTLQHQGIDPFSVARVWSRSLYISPVSNAELSVFTHLLAQLLQSGFSLIDALDAIQDAQGEELLSSILMHITTDIESGISFSEALSPYTSVFSPLYVAMIQTAEISGKMPEVLFELERLLIWQDSMKSRIKKVTFYPLFSAIVLFVVIIYLMVYLVPNLTAFIATTGFTLPWYTDVLLAVSDYVGRYYGYMLGVVITMPVVLFLISRQSLAAQYYFSKILLSLPGIGAILENSKLSRLTFTVGTMYASGVPVLQALVASEPTLTNEYLQHQLLLGLERVRSGESIGSGLSVMFANLRVATRIITLGEKGGMLDSSLLQLSDIYNDRVNQSIERFEALIGPTLIILIGSLLIWVIVAVIGPIYDAVFSVAGNL